MADSNTPVLKTPDGQPAAGKPLVVSKNGLALQLELTAGNKLDSANLSLQAAGQDESLTAIFTTDQGAVQGTTWPMQPVNWLIADWGVDRPLTAIQIQAAAGKARLKVFTAGAWIPLYPIDIVATGVEQRFSPVLASKVMVELVKAGDYPGIWLPNPTQVTGVTLKATRQPCDLSLAIAEQPPFFHHAGPLPTTAIEVTGLTQAINAYLDAPKPVLPVPLRLQAAVPGELQLTFNATAVTVIRQLDNAGPDGSLEIPWQGEAVGRVTLSANAILKAISFVAAFNPYQEKLLLYPASIKTGLTQLCDSNHSAAQGFQLELQEKVITGLDLYLYPRSAKLEATLSLHPDLNGRPAPSPYGQASIPIHWQAEANDTWKERWVSCQLPQPLWIKDTNWWVVLNVSAGETLWAIGDNLPEGVRKEGCLYQIAGGAWLPRRLPLAWSASPRAYTRLRISAPGPKSLKPIVLRRGEKSMTCTMDAEGRVQLDEKNLDTLKNTEPLLEIAITADSAGRMTLRDLWILYG